MRFLCKIGFHNLKPVQAFLSYVIKNMNKSNKNFIKTEESWTGFQCVCGKKKIRRNHYHQSGGATQEAYDWLNDRPKKAEILTMVRGGK